MSEQVKQTEQTGKPKKNYARPITWLVIILVSLFLADHLLFHVVTGKSVVKSDSVKVVTPASDTLKKDVLKTKNDTAKSK
jgi:hypothetical protein